MEEQNSLALKHWHPRKVKSDQRILQSEKELWKTYGYNADVMMPIEPQGHQAD